MNVLIADKLSPVALKELEGLGLSLRFEPGLSAVDLPGVIDNADILIVRSTKVTAETIDAGKNLSLIIRAGAGVNTIDLDRASLMGIHVANCPGKNADAVAELAVGLIIAADRRIANQTVDIRAGVWNKKEYGKAAGLKGRTLGVLGYGSIGKCVASLGRAMGMNVVAWSRSLTSEKAAVEGIGYCESPRELAQSADVVSVHLASNSATKGLINTDFLKAMKAGSIFVNTSRGEVVDREALFSVAKSGHLKVGLDVYSDEPGSGDNQFKDMELAGLITGTHHVGASTDQASDAIATETVRVVRSYMEAGKPVNLVNAREKSASSHGLTVRHFNHVGVLAGVLDSLREAGINVEEMENAVFSGGAAAVCTLKLDQKPNQNVLRTIREQKEIIQAVPTSQS